MSLAAQVSNDFLALVDSFLRPLLVPAAVIAATRTSGSPGLTAVGSLAGVNIGAVVTGTGIPSTPPTTVIAMDNAAHTVTLSANATASGTSNLTFQNPGPASAPQMGLYTNNFTPTPATLLTDFVEPTYPGYARQPMTVNPLKIDALGNYIQDYQSVHFQPTGVWVGAVPCIGYFVTFTVGGTTVWLYAEPFAAPINLVQPTDSTDILFDGYVSNLKVWGGLCSQC